MLGARRSIFGAWFSPLPGRIPASFSFPHAPLHKTFPLHGARRPRTPQKPRHSRTLARSRSLAMKSNSMHAVMNGSDCLFYLNEHGSDRDLLKNALQKPARHAKDFIKYLESRYWLKNINPTTAKQRWLETAKRFLSECGTPTQVPAAFYDAVTLNVFQSYYQKEFKMVDKVGAVVQAARCTCTADLGCTHLAGDQGAHPQDVQPVQERRLMCPLQRAGAAGSHAHSRPGCICRRSCPSPRCRCRSRCRRRCR